MTLSTGMLTEKFFVRSSLSLIEELLKNFELLKKMMNCRQKVWIWTVIYLVNQILGEIKDPKLIPAGHHQEQFFETCC